MIGRIRSKEASEVGRLKKLRKLKASVDARTIHEDFLGDDEVEVEQASLCQVCDAGGGSDEEFWNELSPIEPPTARIDTLVARLQECVRKWRDHPECKG